MTLRFGPFLLNPRERTLVREGNVLPITPKEFDTLLLLAANSGRLLTKDEMIGQIWPDSFVSESSLTRNISVLRKLLGPEWIETVPKQGYRFRADVVQVPDPETAASQKEPAPSPQRVVEGSRKRRLIAVPRLAWVAAAVLVLIAIALFGELRFRELGEQPHTPRVLVLPVRTLEPTSADEYLADGITGEMIAALQRCAGNHAGIVSRDSAMRFKNAPADVETLRRKLNPDYVLQSVLQPVARDEHRLSLDLVRVSDGERLWSGEYDLSGAELPTVPRQVSFAVMQKIAPDTMVADSAAAAIDPQAYRDYLKGRFFADQRNKDALEKSIKYYEQAVERDPDFAEAYAGLARTYLVLGGGYIPGREGYGLGRQNAERALALDPNLAAAHADLGYEKFIDEWDWSGAEREFRRAIALNPQDTDAHHWYAVYLAAMKRFPEALAQIREALKFDPLSQPFNYNYGMILMQAGRVDDAIRQLQRTIEMYPNSQVAWGYLGLAYERKHQFQQAYSAFRNAAERSGGSHLYDVDTAQALALEGRRREADHILTGLKAWSRRHPVGACNFAVIYTAMDEKDLAFQWLQKAVDDRSCTATEIETDDELAPLRNDPRFAQIRAELRLPN